MRSLVVGGDGLVGAALVRRLRAAGHEVTPTSRRGRSREALYLDLTHPSQSDPLPSVDVAFLLAAVTSQVACRDEPDLAWQVNVRGTLEVATRLSAAHTHLVMLSSNLVLPGDLPRAAPETPLSPRGEYASHKAALERGLASLATPVTILRVTKVAETLMPLLQDWACALRTGHPIAPFSDLACAPLPLEAVAEALLRIADRRVAGIVHLGAEPDLTYLDIARRLAEGLGAHESLLQPTTMAAAGVRLAVPPLHTTLDSASSQRRLGLSAFDSRETVTVLLERLRS